MSEFNLIPPDFARELALRRRLRRAAAGFIVLCGLIVLARSGLALLIAAEREQVAQLQAQERLWRERKTRTEKYTSEALAAEKQLAALDELRGREHLRLFLEALDRAYVDKVWFDEIRYYRKEIAPHPVPASGVRTASTPVAEKSTAGPGPRRVEQRVGMTGHALNHVTLAEFMKNLESQPAVAELTLIDTSPRNYPNAVITDFKLGLLIERNLKVRP